MRWCAGVDDGVAAQKTAHTVLAGGRAAGAAHSMVNQYWPDSSHDTDTHHGLQSHLLNIIIISHPASHTQSPGLSSGKLCIIMDL